MYRAVSSAASDRARGSRIFHMRKFAIVALLLVSACAPKAVLPPVVSAPKFPDLVPPPIPPAFANTLSALAEDRGWRFLQAGDLKAAEREFAAALTAAPAFYPAEISLGYLETVRP